jgi:GTPase
MSEQPSSGGAHPAPLVAIVGRPNVGKSTLFNRLVRRRTAITHPTPGVTRDIVEEVVTLRDRRILFADTGGLSREGDALVHLVARRSIGILSRADLILFVVDVTDLTPEDEEFAEELMPHREKVVLVANKVDSEKREELLGECYTLGFDTLLPVSAEHGRGIEELQDALLAALPEPETLAEETAEGPTMPAVPRVAILGQPNTGKSTLLNALLGEERALVSEIPGTTRDRVSSLVNWKGRDLVMVDTAGIRRKSRVSDDLEYYSVNRSIHSIDEADIILLMIDAEKGLAAQDKKIASLAVDRGRGVVLVLNKWDLVPQLPNAFRAVKDRIEYLFPVLHFAPVVAISAHTGENLDQLIKTVFGVYAELNRRVDTGPLNRSFQRWVDKYPPPVVRGGRIKLRYITQVSANPVTFVVFTNRKGLTQEYISYLKNQIRKEIGFADVPVRIDVRTRDVEPRGKTGR